MSFILCSLSIYSQTDCSDTIRFKLLFNKNEPMRGATLYVKDSNPPHGTTSDINGNAELILADDESIIELSFLGPYVAFKIKQPVDSVFLNLNDKKVIYFHNSKKIKKKRLKIDGY